jgi:phage terminase small subunit
VYFVARDFSREGVTMDGGGGVALAAGAISRDRHSGQFVTGADLTAQQRAFVGQYVANGGKGTEAAREAGYAEPSREAWRLMRNPAVLAAIREENARVLYAEVATASTAAILLCLRDPGARQSDKMQAARLGLEAAKIIKRDKTDANPLGSKALSEMSMDELETFIAAGNAALAGRDAKVIEGDSAQDSAQLEGAEPVTP